MVYFSYGHLFYTVVFICVQNFSNYFSVLNIWWMVLWCSQRLKTLLKTFWQIIQVSGPSEPCWTLMCLDKLLRRIDLAQCGQLVITPATKDSVRIWPMRSCGKWMKDFPNKTLHIFFSNASFEDNTRQTKFTAGTCFDKLGAQFSCALSNWHLPYISCHSIHTQAFPVQCASWQCAC